MSELNLIHLSGGIPVMVDTPEGPKVFHLNNEGIKVLQLLGPEKFVQKAGATALKFLVG